jgi:flavorubredoxin
MVSLDKLGHEYRFSSGRTLGFINTPYAHSQGSFVTFDEKTGILFSSDIFGSYALDWEFFIKLEKDCVDCRNLKNCSKGKTVCPIEDILNFHRVIMTSNRALKYALEQLGGIPFKIIAPQHGSIIRGSVDIVNLFERLLAMPDEHRLTIVLSEVILGRR